MDPKREGFCNGEQRVMESTLEQIAFVFTKSAKDFWMPACAGITEVTLQEGHFRERGNPV